MSKVYNLYRGGAAVGSHNFCCDGTNQYSEMPPKQVAAEYDLGSYTYSFAIAPAAMKWQRNAFKAVDPLKEEDFISCLRVPEKHEIRGVTLELAKDDAAFTEWTINLQMRIFTEGELTETVNVTSDAISLAEKDGLATFVYSDEFDRVLKAGEHAEIGVVVRSTKDDDVLCVDAFDGQINVLAVVQRLTAGTSVH